MKKVLLAVKTLILSLDVENILSSKDNIQIIKTRISHLDTAINEHKPDLLITQFNSRLKNILLSRIPFDVPILLLGNTLKTGIDLELIKNYKMDFLHIPLDYNELEDKLNKLL